MGSRCAVAFLRKSGDARLRRGGRSSYRCDAASRKDRRTNACAAARPRVGQPTEDRMAKIRALSIAATLGLALLTTASPAAAYVIEALTSISATEGADKATLEKAIRAAVDDIATHAVAFTPT